VKYASQYGARQRPAGASTRAQPDRAIAQSLAPFDRAPRAENPYNIQQDLQDAMQRLVGHRP